MKRFKLSEKLFREAKENLVGGVNSPVRSYRDFNFAPPFISHAKGSHIVDVDKNDYIDYVGSFGPMILGHAHPAVISAIRGTAEQGISFGAPTERETELARMVKEAFPSIDLLRFVSSGTEATMSAIRLARGYTGRDEIIKFNGCYHGHSDNLLVKAGSGAMSMGTPDSAGVPEDFAKHTLVAEYNDLGSVERLVETFKDQVATIIVEPIAGNMGTIPPSPGFLEGLRSICDQNDIVLIFDEVITGFRVAFGGAQELYGIQADITCLGKILGGGLPIGAYGGKKAIMEKVSPIGSVYQAGTLSGNPLSVAAGIATLKVLNSPVSAEIQQLTGIEESDVYKHLDIKTLRLTMGVGDRLNKKNIKHSISRVGSLFTTFFVPGAVTNYFEVMQCDRHIFQRYFIHMLEGGVYLAPSPFESGFMSLAHTADDIEQTLELVDAL